MTLRSSQLATTMASIHPIVRKQKIRNQKSIDQAASTGFYYQNPYSLSPLAWAQYPTLRRVRTGKNFQFGGNFKGPVHNFLTANMRVPLGWRPRFSRQRRPRRAIVRRGSCCSMARKRSASRSSSLGAAVVTSRHDVVTLIDFFGNRRIIKNVLAAFSVEQTVKWLASLGGNPKREETGKLFPVTDKVFFCLP